jgi:hypothetical protein
MLTADQAKAVAAEYRPRFSSEEAFSLSWKRFFEPGVGPGMPSYERLVDWLASDLAKDQAKAAGLIKAPILPVRQDVRDTGCFHCGGVGFTVSRAIKDAIERGELPIDHADFGKAFACAACNRQDGRVCHCRECEGFAREVADHRLCVDLTTGHDYEHPQDCPRCLENGVDQAAASPVEVMRQDGSVDYVATLLARMRVRSGKVPKVKVSAGQT